MRGDWVKRTCCRMAGEEKFGYFRLSEGTEGEDGSLSSGCGWLEVLCVWRLKLIILVLSVKKVAKSSAVIEVVGGGEGGLSSYLGISHTSICS